MATDPKRFKKRKADTLSYEIKLLQRPEASKLAEKAIKKNGVNYSEFYPDKFDLYRVDEFERKRLYDADTHRKAQQPIQLQEIVDSHVMMKAIRRKNELSVQDKIALLEKTLEKHGSPMKKAKKKKK